MLDKVTIKGFKSIRSVEELEIRPINALIGANGSGKSNHPPPTFALRVLILYYEV